MKYLLTMLLCSIAMASYAQHSTTFKLKSTLCKFHYVKTGEDTMRHEHAFINHTIIVRKDKKEIVTYDDTEQFRLDILDISKENKNNSEWYVFKCLNTSNMKEIKAKLWFFENKPMTFEIDFGESRVEYMLDEFFEGKK